MLKFRKNITHCFQSGNPNCGPVALHCVFDNPISEIEKLVKCTRRGTSTFDVVNGLRAEGIACAFISLDVLYENHLWWLQTCSYRWPIYVSCDFVNQGKQGRPSHSHHAVLFANGMCYDGHNHREEPLAAIGLKFNRRFVINAIVIIEHELPDWRKNMESA